MLQDAPAARRKTCRKHYGFEQAILAKRAALYDENDNYYKTFLKNLDLCAKDLDPSAEFTLKKYVTAVHINADWYNRRVRAELRRQTLFLSASIALLVLVPLIVYYIGTNYGGQAAALTGLYAMHRAVYAWMKRRALVVPYWRARSNLLHQIHTLETDWRLADKVKKIRDDGRLTEAFADALYGSMVSSRAIVVEADEKFFASYELPDFNLQGELSKASASVGTLVSSFESETAKAERARLTAHKKLEDELRDAEIDAAALTVRREALEKRLSDLKNDDASRAALDEQIQTARNAESDKNAEVAERKAKVEVSRRSIK